MGYQYIQILLAPTEGTTDNIGESSLLRNLLNVKHCPP